MSSPSSLVMHVETADQGMRAAIARAGSQPQAWTPANRETLPALFRGWSSQGVVERAELLVPFHQDSLALLAASCVGALLVGFAPATAERVRLCARLNVAGEIDVTGSELRPLDEAFLHRELPPWMARHGVVILAVGGINSTMNSAHEQRAAELARAVTGLTAVEARYFRREISAIDRVMAAGLAAAWWMNAREAIEAVRRAIIEAGMDAPIRLTGPDAEMLPVISRAAHDLLGQQNTLLANTPLRAEARVTRVRQECYACHCDDGRFEFPSLAAAKAFGEEHLRRQLASRAQEMGMAGTGVRVQSADRYGRGQGRKGTMRVYLDSTIQAWID